MPCVAIDQARQNLEEELSVVDAVDQVALQNRREWDAALSSIEVQGSSSAQERVLCEIKQRLIWFGCL